MVFAFQPQLFSFKGSCGACVHGAQTSLSLTADDIIADRMPEYSWTPSPPLCAYVSQGGVHPIPCYPLCYPHPVYYIRQTVVRLLLRSNSRSKRTYYDCYSNFQNCYSMKGRKREREADREDKELALRGKSLASRRLSSLL